MEEQKIQISSRIETYITMGENVLRFSVNPDKVDFHEFESAVITLFNDPDINVQFLQTS